MSGGSFNYAFRRVETFVEELDSKLRRAATPPDTEYEDGSDRETTPEFSPNTLSRLTEIAQMSEHLAKMMREVEYLYSGDTSEESFHASVAELAATMPAAPGVLPASSGHRKVGTEGAD